MRRLPCLRRFDPHEQGRQPVEELQAHKQSLKEKFAGLFDELKRYWGEWDAAEDSGNEDVKRKVRDKMVDLLNRRSYIRNLVRDVNEVLEN